MIQPLMIQPRSAEGSENDFTKLAIASPQGELAVVDDQDGAVGPVCDSLAYASESAEAVQSTRADDDEIRLA
jgi:hypothetical protein